ncbi:MAG: Fe-S cluster assembly ATPase SufC [Gammaproteobacteria bacterium]
MLELRNLHVAIGDRMVLKGVNLEVPAGELHAVMGPNGSGKSTLVQTLAGAEPYRVTDGQAHFLGSDLLAWTPEERARHGLFLAFQYPVEIPGLGNAYFLRSSVNAIRRARGEAELDAADFLSTLRSELSAMEMKPELLERSVNQGFSGGEKKRNEILQMKLLKPCLALLDETDSGLDIDALKIVARGINAMRDRKRGFLVVTHYQRLLDYVEPDRVHVLVNGRIVQSGEADLAQMLEQRGYDWLTELSQV